MPFSQKKSYHFVGIGGIGMSGLARILIQKNHVVSGSDVCESSLTQDLQKLGVKIFIGHSERHITPDMTVVLSTDIKKENPEYIAAQKFQCPLLHRSEVLNELMMKQNPLAVTGTHGKTTTSGLLATVLNDAGCAPSFCVGGILAQFDSNAGFGTGRYFVAEADESDGSFLNYHPYGAIVTNVDFDHMDYFKNEQTLLNTFKVFMEQTRNQELLFWCGDDENLQKITRTGISYGFKKHCQLQCIRMRQLGWTSFFDMTFDGKCYSDIELNLIGHHNILNASAVFGLALRLGSQEERIRHALKSFRGISRRCEKKGCVNSILFIDDYAHHPVEIRTTLRALKTTLPNHRFFVIFQPHRYTRTRDCLGQFGSLFDEIEELILLDIYGAGEDKIPGINSALIFKEIQGASKAKSHYLSKEEALQYLLNNMKPQDVVVTLGAGDVTKIGPELISFLSF